MEANLWQVTIDECDDTNVLVDWEETKQYEKLQQKHLLFAGFISLWRIGLQEVSKE